MTLQNPGSWDGAAAALEMFSAFQTAASTMIQYTAVHSMPFFSAAAQFNRVERERLWSRTPMDNLLSYLKLGTLNMKLAGRALHGDMRAIDQFLTMVPQAHVQTDGSSEAFTEFAQRMHRLTDGVAYTFPAAIHAIKNEFGFHFERQPASSRIDETDRFYLYQVLPTNKAETRANGKPVLIIPPFVLGANILAFLPMEKRSYAHAFANQGIPTYIRILKNIQDSEAVQLMGPEDEVKDMRRFCEALKARHGQPLTLNGYCQGGFAALCDLLSGELDGLVDAFITCVSPMDGSRSKGLGSFLKDLPQEFNDLAYGTKTLPNGNKVIDGNLMSWIYKLKNMENETPLLNLSRDMLLVSKSNGDPSDVNKTAAAIYYWLLYDRGDLPLKITRMSFDSYNTPISKDGTLPIKLFGRSLNLRRLEEKKIPWLICYGKQDDLVEPASALAPIDYVNAEVTGYPKGHVAIATSWSHPDSPHALHLRYQDENTRGPVRFQLDLQEMIDRAGEDGQPVKARKEETLSESESVEKTGKNSPKPSKKVKLKAATDPDPVS